MAAVLEYDIWGLVKDIPGWAVLHIMLELSGP